MDHPMDSSAEENIVEESHKLVNSLDKLSVSAASSSSNFKKKPVIIIVVGMACWICDSHMLPCFLIRCIVVGVSAFDRDLTLDVLDHPVLNLIYYMVVEVLPSALVLFILRKLPPKRVSAQYHPIQ